MPRKMAHFMNMSLFFGFLLFVVCLLISYSSSNITAADYVEETLGGSYFIDYKNRNYESVGEEITLPTLEYMLDSDGNYYYAICDKFPTNDGNQQHVFDNQYRDSETGDVLNLKFVYELEYYETGSKEENPTVPERFQGTYLLKVVDKTIVVEVLPTGKGYYDGTEVAFTYTADSNEINATKDNISVKIAIVENNYQVTATNKEGTQVSIESVQRLFSTSNLRYFDFQAYFEEKTGKEKGVDDVLIIYTRTLVYYLYNRGYTSTEDPYNYITMPDNKGKLQHPIYNYYLPSNQAEALLPEEQWTKTASYGEKVEFSTIEYTAFPKTINPSLAAIFAYNSPILSYHNARAAKIDILNTSPSNIAKILTEFNITSWTDSVKFQTSCTAAVPFGFLLPLLCILITWLMSRKRGVMKTFKEYFNLAAFAAILPTIVCFILGFFVQYTQFIFYTIIIQLGFYIFAAYRVNTMKNVSTSTQTTTDTLVVEDGNVIDTSTDKTIVEKAKVEETNDKDDDIDTPNYIG